MPNIKTAATGAVIAGAGVVLAVGFLRWARQNDIQPFADWTEAFQGL